MSAPGAGGWLPVPRTAPDDERVTIDARLTARDDAPRQMEASVEYRVRFFGSSDERFTHEYVWRQQVAF